MIVKLLLKLLSRSQHQKISFDRVLSFLGSVLQDHFTQPCLLSSSRGKEKSLEKIPGTWGKFASPPPPACLSNPIAPSRRVKVPFHVLSIGILKWNS